MNLAFLLRQVLRELRGAPARLLPFLASLAVGVAAIVLVAGLGDSVSRAVRMEARPLLGADVAVRSFEPLPHDLDEASAQFPVERADTVDLLTMVALPSEAGVGRSLLAELKAVSPGWPFYGVPTTEPADALATLSAEQVLVEPALLERLRVTTGDPVRIGGAPFTIAGTITKEPGRMPSGLVAGPRVVVTLEGLARAGIGEAGARITHRALFRAPDEVMTGTLAAWLRERGGARVNVETWSDAQPTAQRSIERTTSYMGLVALLSLVVGGVGVAQATRAWMARRLDALAVQRTLGLTSAELAAVALGQTVLLAGVGSTVGAAIGLSALKLAPVILAGLLPAEAVDPWQPAAALRGIALGVGVALLFAARPQLQAVNVPALRVLRRDVEPLPERPIQALAAGATLLAGVFGLAWLQVHDLVVAAVFAGALAVVAGSGAGLATVVARGLGAVAPSAGRWWLRHGLAAVGRPGSGVVPAVVSLAVGVVVVLTTVLVEGRIFARISGEFPKEAPSAFLVDVQPDQEAGVLALLGEAGAARVRTAPMIVARLAAVDDEPVDALVARRGEDARWSLTREQRLSYMPTLPAGNRILSGAPFSDAVPNELSIEQRYAESLGVTVGSRVRFDVQGVPIDLVVTSVREVSWETFDMNFFLVVEPGVLEAAPRSVLVTAQLDAAGEPAFQDRLAAAFPNVTLVSVRSLLTQARGMVERLGWGVRFVGAFTALAGVAILASGVAADAARQGRKVALLKTLGTTRAGVVALFAVEYGILGLLAGILGAGGAVGVARVIVTRMMHLPWRTDWTMLGAGVAASVILCAVVGVLANARALRVRPAEVLRGEV